MTQRFGDVSKEIQRVRKQMEQDEQLATLMRGLRGQNLRDEQFADDNVRLRLVEVNLLDPTSVNLSPSVLSSSIITQVVGDFAWGCSLPTVAVVASSRMWMRSSSRWPQAGCVEKRELQKKSQMD